MKSLSELSGAELKDAVNASRFDIGSVAGFYESFFLRANHPTRPLAFWIRYTLFSPQGRSDQAQGQLWSIFFNGESEAITAIKQSVAIEACTFSTSKLLIRLGSSSLDEKMLQGTAVQGTHRMTWDLRYDGASNPSFLLPLSLYGSAFPKAKALSGIPLADFDGVVSVDDENIEVSNWRGSQNHNWGLKHTDQYAWGQVAGFDTHPDAFLECTTARVRVGPLWTPWLTNVVLRIGPRDIRLNSLAQGLRNQGKYRCFQWAIECRRGPLKISIEIEAPRGRFVGLAYDDPPGGQKTCLNTKLAACVVRLDEAGRSPVKLYTRSRAAFEILTTASDHGVPISA
jgi:hypothetical protein